MGTRIAVYKFSEINGDHPHACGDKHREFPAVRSRWGSSPRVWGQAYLAYVFSEDERIIPTRVGTSGICRSSRNSGWDHPHACGDKLLIFYTYLIMPGSSPRVWGQEDIPYSLRTRLRIIPTRVGTSTSAFFAVAIPMDHPHACGDKF